MIVTLQSGPATLELDPKMGGSVRALRIEQRDILRPGPANTRPAPDPLLNASFPMVPFVGRIHRGEANWQGSVLTLPANMPPEPHAIHGHGWRSEWRVDAAAPDRTTLHFEHQADAWPWSYRAFQEFSLRPNGLDVTLGITNLDRTPMPVGLGWHPYFYRAEAHLVVATTHEWFPDLEGHDNRPAPISTDDDLSAGRQVEALDLDTTYSISRPTACISWPSHRVVLDCDPIFSHTTVFVPPGEDFFCVEPVTHAPNAINSTRPATMTGHRVLAPNANLVGTIRLTVET